MEKYLFSYVQTSSLEYSCFFPPLLYYSLFLRRYNEFRKLLCHKQILNLGQVFVACIQYDIIQKSNTSVLSSVWHILRTVSNWAPPSLVLVEACSCCSYLSVECWRHASLCLSPQCWLAGLLLSPGPPMSQGLAWQRNVPARLALLSHLKNFCQGERLLLAVSQSVTSFLSDS